MDSASSSLALHDPDSEGIQVVRSTDSENDENRNISNSNCGPTPKFKIGETVIVKLSCFFSSATELAKLSTKKKAIAKGTGMVAEVVEVKDHKVFIMVKLHETSNAFLYFEHMQWKHQMYKSSEQVPKSLDIVNLQTLRQKDLSKYHQLIDLFLTAGHGTPAPKPPVTETQANDTEDANGADEAESDASDEHRIESIIAHAGDPDDPDSMDFQVRFTDDDGGDDDENWLPMKPDLYRTPFFEAYCNARPELKQLLLSPENAAKLKREMRRKEISLISPGDIVYVDIRAWGAGWYAQLELPDKYRVTYVAECRYGCFCGPKGKSRILLSAQYPAFCTKWEAVNNWHVSRYGHQKVLKQGQVLITKQMVRQYNLRQSDPWGSGDDNDTTNAAADGSVVVGPVASSVAASSVSDSMAGSMAGDSITVSHKTTSVRDPASPPPTSRESPIPGIAVETKDTEMADTPAPSSTTVSDAAAAETRAARDGGGSDDIVTKEAASLSNFLATGTGTQTRTAWQSSGHTQVRKKMRVKVLELLQARVKNANYNNSEASQKYPMYANAIEVALYNTASSLANYLDNTTLVKRIKELTRQQKATRKAVTITAVPSEMSVAARVSGTKAITPGGVGSSAENLTATKAVVTSLTTQGGTGTTAESISMTKAAVSSSAALAVSHVAKPALSTASPIAPKKMSLTSLFAHNPTQSPLVASTVFTKAPLWRPDTVLPASSASSSSASSSANANRPVFALTGVHRGIAMPPVSSTSMSSSASSSSSAAVAVVVVPTVRTTGKRGRPPTRPQKAAATTTTAAAAETLDELAPQGNKRLRSSAVSGTASSQRKVHFAPRSPVSAAHSTPPPSPRVAPTAASATIGIDLTAEVLEPPVTTDVTDATDDTGTTATTTGMTNPSEYNQDSLDAYVLNPETLWFDYRMSAQSHVFTDSHYTTLGGGVSDSGNVEGGQSGGTTAMPRYLRVFPYTLQGEGL